jgi:DNA-binding protein HU-beta
VHITVGGVNEFTKTLILGLFLHATSKKLNKYKVFPLQHCYPPPLCHIMADKKPLSKSQLLSALADKTNLSKKDVDGFLEAITEIAYKEAKSVGKFTLPGFGILKLVQRAARTGRNPATGATIQIPAKTVVKMTLSKACKEAIAGAPKKK